MSAQAIEVKGLGKEYRIGAQKRIANASGLLETVTEGARNLLQRRRSSRETETDRRFWALKDIDLSIGTGEVVGVIGRNGSGKSTLLKILSDIVEPTEGRARIRGRVASLLEVGTGFHSELTGRENIYLNGALIGMKQHEVRANFDRIVEFSGVGKFLDTPVKRYSSGMYVRLAFAVAAHLEPEVLIVDEVLAVGDFSFQQKCLGRMQDVARDGRTVLFVSHNLAAVEALCSRCVLLDGGRLVADGAPYEVTREFRRKLSDIGGNAEVSLEELTGAARKVRVLTRARMLDETGALTTFIPVSRAFELRIGLRLPSGLQNVVCVVCIDSNYGTRMLTLTSPVNDGQLNVVGDQEITCRVDEFPLAPGAYRISLIVLSRNEVIDKLDGILALTVTNGEIYREGRGAQSGMCIARADWRIGAKALIANSSTSQTITVGEAEVSASRDTNELSDPSAVTV